MTDLFRLVLELSIDASWLIVLVMALRLLLVRAPKWSRVLLWGLVAVRLVCPFSIESPVSLVPDFEPITQAILAEPPRQTAEELSGTETEQDKVPAVSPAQDGFDAGTLVSGAWLVGAAGMLLYGTVSYGRLRRRLATAVPLRGRIYQSEFIDSPCVLGLLRPRIYLPFSLGPGEVPHVLAHERAHIRRGDPWWKTVGFLLLAVHWFNPLVWAAYVLLCRDIELACDEKVIKTLDREQRADYS